MMYIGVIALFVAIFFFLLWAIGDAVFDGRTLIIQNRYGWLDFCFYTGMLSLVFALCCFMIGGFLYFEC